jgi:hypothetical protein
VRYVNAIGNPEPMPTFLVPNEGSRGSAMLRPIVHFVAILLAALALVPAGAHVLELTRKMTLSEADYFVAQSLYRGWALSGIIIIALLIAEIGLAILLRHEGRRLALAAAAGVSTFATLVIFFIWTQPANAATDNWTTMPDNWEALRRQWEYSHAAGAAFALAALAFLSAAALVGSAHEPS